jgi:hypothetical protein
MDNVLNMTILANPINWLIVVMILIFVAYGAFVVYSNASSLTPKIG